MTDFYKILGLERNASNEEIKKAYRKLSLKFHPDKNQGDKFFENMFKQIQEAYDVLGNQNKKNIYDLELNRKTYEDSKRYQRTNESKYNDIEPKIEYFKSNTNSFYNGSQVTFNWKVLNADIVELVPFGKVNSKDEKTYKLKNIKNQFLYVRLKATNTKSLKSTYQEILLRNEDRNENSTLFRESDIPKPKKINQDESFWSTKGRLRRTTFFIRNFILAIIVGVLSSMMDVGQNEESTTLIIISLIFVIIMAIQAVKRLHDMNMSGWWYFILIIPYINILFGIFILFNPGTKGENRYGFDPREN